MNSKKTVLILGASRYYTGAIETARRIGCRLIVTDRNPDAPGLRIADIAKPIDIKDKKAILDTARSYKIDAIVPLNDFGVQTAAFVADQMGLPGISPKSAELATCKGAMRSAWADAGVPSVQFKVVNSLQEAIDIAKWFSSFPLIVKPNDSRGGGSRGVSRVDKIEELPEAVEFAQSQYPDRQDVIIEQYVRGREFSAETITYNGNTMVIAIGEKEKTRGKYRVDKSVIYPADISATDLARIMNAITAAIHALDIDFGPAHVEFCLTATGPVLFELGARCGGGGTPEPIVPWVTGYSMFTEVIKMYLGMAPTCYKWSENQRGSVYRFLTPKPGIFAGIDGMDEIVHWPGILDCGVSIRKGDRIRNIQTGLHRSGFIITGMPTRQEAVELANQAEKALRFRYID